jgi:hypothetical protein
MILWRTTIRVLTCSIPLLAPGLIAADEPPIDPMTAFNDASRAIYWRAKQAALSRTGPLIVVEGDKLVFKRGGNRIETHVTPDVFHFLKGVAHIPLALDVMFASIPDEADGRLDDDMVAQLRTYRALIEVVRNQVLRRDLPKEQAERQAAIIDASLGIVEPVLATRTCRSAERIAFARRMAPLVLANVTDATRAQLDAVHRQLGQWRQGLSAAEWERLTVVVMGHQLPRQGNVFTQYFARLLGEAGEGNRIVYAESLLEEQTALDLLATRLVDTKIGYDFFDDSTRMYRDLLGDAARDYLPLLFGKSEDSVREAR